jgi:hypothetical protein
VDSQARGELKPRKWNKSDVDTLAATPIEPRAWAGSSADSSVIHKTFSVLWTQV